MSESTEDQGLWRREITARMDSFEEKLDGNTDATERIEASTTELLDLLNSWKGAMRVLEILGKVAKPIAAITALVAGIIAMWPKK
jgi:hypothetical protein